MFCSYTSFVGLFPLLSRGIVPLVKVDEISQTIDSNNFTVNLLLLSCAYMSMSKRLSGKNDHFIPVYINSRPMLVYMFAGSKPNLD